MYKHKPIGRAVLFSTTLCVLTMGFTPTAIGHEEATELLKITVGEPTKLSPLGSQSSAVLAASRAGVVAAFYPNRKWIPSTRVSKDGGATWSKEVPAPRGGGRRMPRLRWPA